MSEGVSSEHRYGGPWTDIKLDAVEYYLKCYTTALSRVPFDLWYIDGFAGTGSRTLERETGGLLEGTPTNVVRELVAGSARRALAIVPPFQHFIFIDDEPEFYPALHALAGRHPGRDVRVVQGDANAEIRRLVTEAPWSLREKSRARGVVFLDPYALQVDWDTLAHLAATTICDVWYLFPLADVVRQLAHDRRGIGAKEPMLDRILGPQWRELYRMPEEVSVDLLGDADPTARRAATKKQIEQWFKKRLESAFPYVSEPLPLFSGKGRQKFSLFLCVANNGPPAINLAKKFVRYVMKHFGPGASRQTSGL